MIGQIINWVYCLPIRDAVAVALLISGGFFGLQYHFGCRRWWKSVTVMLLICWAGAVLACTVLDRSEEGATASLIPLQTYVTVYQGGSEELLRSAFMNVLLFYPGGLLLLSVFPKWKWWLVAAGFVAASVGIELCQYCFRLGYAEVDDVLHNTLGALLGIAAFRQFQKYNKIPKG